MINEDKAQQLADDIYSKCGVQIRYCDCHAVAQKLLELYLITKKELKDAD